MMQRVTWVIVLFLFCALSAATADAQEKSGAGKLLFANAMGPMPAGPGQVGFFRSDVNIPGHPIELFAGNVKTGKEVRVLPGHNFRQDPTLVAAWSPDGKDLMVPGMVDGNWELMVYKNGSRNGVPVTNLDEYRVNVTEKERDDLSIGPEQQLSFAEMAFSPSGKRLIFTLTRLAKTAVWWHDLKSNTTRQATEDRKGYAASLHPDDDHFAYTQMVKKESGSADEDILWRSIATGKTDTICGSTNHESRPVVSPDGKYLLYVKKVGGVLNVHVMNLTTRESRQVTFAESGQNCNLACWSSDGKDIYVQGAGFVPQTSVFINHFESF